MVKRVGIYLRVSTKNGQTVENQRQALVEVIGRRPGWTLVEEYADEGISGAKGRDQRPEFDRLLKDIVRRRIDIVAAWSVDRLGRSLQDLVGFLGELNSAGGDLYLEKAGDRYDHPIGQNAVSDAWGICGIRAGADPGTDSCGACQGARKGNEKRQTDWSSPDPTP